MLSLLDEIQNPDLPARARPEVAAILRLPEDALKSVRALLPSLPNPEQSAHFLKRLIQESPAGADAITRDIKALRYTLTVFSYSQFLSAALIRYPEWILEIARADDLHRGILREEYEESLLASLPAGETARAIDFALFRRKHILRIVLRDTLRHADLSETAEDLSNLADAILNVAWRTVRSETSAAMGVNGQKFSVIALGKLGARELNYSSDIDLMFVYGGEDEHAAAFFRTAANRLTALLSAYTAEGMCYRVDLRLRPDGSLGELCQPLTAAKRYYANRARDWELQMLIKARVSAGDPSPGRELLDFAEPLIYRTTTDFRMIEAVSETRARIHEKQDKRSRTSGLDVKLARGGIRDIEFLVQCLQRLHGGREPWVRHGGTLLALSRLRDKELLSGSEYSRLVSAYQFLRHLEHRLQFDEDRQTHTLPRDGEALDSLARKMPPGLPGIPRAGTLERALDRHFECVQNLYDRVIDSQRPALSASETLTEPLTDPEPAVAYAEVFEGPARPDFPSVNLARYLELMAPRFFRVLTSGVIRRGQESMESFLEKIVAQPQWLRTLDSNEELAQCTIDVFEHSQYFADQLVRRPELLSEVEQACSIRQGRTGFIAPRDPVHLRRFFREQMVRIQSDSVYHRVPVFRTLKRTSELAESLIQAASEIAVREALETTPVPAGYTPSTQLMVVALGRLGMREFDLASDADLVFVVPDEDSEALEFWTVVAENIIRIISAYTGDGVIFNIDSRLRPHGREGPLVQTVSGYREYFDRHAEAWEGISYMKARAIAGDIERGTKFLNRLQQLDWRRYGQSGRSRSELAQMRARVEREQGGRNPLKAGPGGYYDIDFALMYLRLRGAGLFYKVLNTPARIEVIEQMGHLDRDDVEMLTHAATFYRAVDHGIRVSTGQPDGRLPANPAQVAVLTDLVARWTPHGFLDSPLESVAKRVRRDTRAFFVRIFGPA